MDFEEFKSKLEDLEKRINEYVKGNSEDQQEKEEDKNPSEPSESDIKAFKDSL